MASTTAPGQPGSHPDLRWLVVWTRAVVGPAVRRADAAWLGCAIVAAVLFGPTGLRPSDLTGLALHDPGVGVVLGAIWLLVYLPIARCIVRATPGAYLRSLPGAPRGALAMSIAALIGLQLPWLALWVLGDGLRGFAIVVATTLLIVALAAWHPPVLNARPPAWRRPGQALRSVHLRALRRRAGDALMRGAGLAVLAGVAAGLPVRNNHLTGESAGVLGASLLAIVLVPAQLGVALVTLGAHRETAWLAASSGITPRTRVAALVYAIGTVNLAATAIGVTAAMIVAGAEPWLAAIAFGVAVGTTLGQARMMVASEASPSAPARVVVGTIAVVALAVVCLAVLGAAGTLAILALGTVALLRVLP